MALTPTPVTAALAGIFSGVTWPLLWPVLNGKESSSTLWLVLATVVLVALPAHAFVMGFARPQPARPGAFDAALLVRVCVWLACGVLTAVVVSLVRGRA